MEARRRQGDRAEEGESAGITIARARRYDRRIVKITLKTFGGIAAGIRRPPLVIDSSRMPIDRCRELERLARSIGAYSGAPASPHPDEMSYHVTIEDGESVREARRSDSTMTPEFAKLVAFVTDNAA